MKKQEMYAWSSLVTSVILLALYQIAVFGLPENMHGNDYITGLFWKVLGIAVAIELVLDLLKEFNIGQGIHDEQDFVIEFKGYRNAYYLLMVTLVLLIINLFISDVAIEYVAKQMFLTIQFMMLHLLVVVVFAGSITKSTTPFYYLKR